MTRALEQDVGELGHRRQVQEGEEDLAGTQQLVLGLERLLHLDHELGLLVHRARVGDDRSAGALVVAVGHAAAGAGAALDHHLVAGFTQDVHGGRMQADAELLVLDFSGNADFHVERATGLEPATSSLGSLHSTN